MRQIKVVIGLAGLALMSASVVSADVIAQYAFNGGSAAVTSSDANATGNDFLKGAGFGGNAGFSGSSQSIFVRSTETFGSSISFGNAKNAEDYFSVTIGANAGYEMDLTSMTFRFGYSSSGGTGNVKTYLTSELDSYASILGSKELTVPGASGVTYPGTQPVTVDLSGAQFQNLTGVTEFRFYFSDNLNNNDVIHRLDDVVLNGTVSAIPEPGTIGLISAAGVSLLYIRRRFMI